MNWIDEIVSDVYSNYIGRANTQKNTEFLRGEIAERLGKEYRVESIRLFEHRDIITRVSKADTGELVRTYSIFGENALREQRHTYDI